LVESAQYPKTRHVNLINLHQAKSNFKDIVSKSKVDKAVIPARCARPPAMFRLVFQSRHWKPPRADRNVALKTRSALQYRCENRTVVQRDSFGGKVGPGESRQGSHAGKGARLASYADWSTHREAENGGQPLMHLPQTRGLLEKIESTKK
jgi:hypothetical protein